MMDETIAGLPCQKKIADMTPQEKENLQRWLLIMWKRLEHGLGRALFAAGVEDAPTKQQEDAMMRILWKSLFRIPLWEILKDEEHAKAFIDGGLVPTSIDEIFQRYRDA